MDWLTGEMEDPIILVGGARGADALGQKWAEWHWYTVFLHLPDYEKYGKGAPFKRNEEMAQDGEYLAAFWDGDSPGTRHMIEMARKYKLKIKIIRYDEK